MTPPAGAGDGSALDTPLTCDEDVAPWVHSLGLGPDGTSGLVDVHVHFLPDRVLRKVWAFFDDATENYGYAWPIHYKLPEDERLARLRSLAVDAFAPLVYPHKPDMAAWLTGWALDWAAEVPEAVPTATLFPEESVTTYLGDAIDRGVRVVKAHVQVGGYDPRDPLLDPAWGMLAEAAVPVIAHCGDGPRPGDFTGLGIIAEVLDRHPRLPLVLAHAGLPDYDEALRLAERHPSVRLDTTMVGTPFTEEFAPVPADWPARLAELSGEGRLVLGTDFPNIRTPTSTSSRRSAPGRPRTIAWGRASSGRSCTTRPPPCSRPDRPTRRDDPRVGPRYDERPCRMPDCRRAGRRG